VPGDEFEAARTRALKELEARDSSAAAGAGH